jgi:hypothetical protein
MVYPSDVIIGWPGGASRCGVLLVGKDHLSQLFLLAMVR